MLTVLAFEHLLKMLLPVQQHEIRRDEQHEHSGKQDLDSPLSGA